MASIRYIVKTKKNPANIYIRFYNSKEFDLTVKTGFIVNPKNWSSKQQRVTKSLDSVYEASAINPKLSEFKEFVINEYNNSYSEGDFIDKNWLEKRVLKFTNRPSDEFSDHEVYFIPFVTKYIKESEKRINPSTGKVISKKTLQKYNTTLSRLQEFEDKEGITLKISDIDLQFHTKFLSFLKIDGNYGSTTIEKYISQIKTFCREAKTLGYKTSPEFEHRSFTARRDKTIDVYLNEKEIKRIFEYDFSLDSRLDNTRDLMIIGLHTGLRISDLKRLSQFNFTADSIEIVDSVKTNAILKIPLHPYVKSIYLKRHKSLPQVISDQKFNKYVKEICKIVGINDQVMGNKMNPNTKRKERGYYPKYELVSSHTCRRSFATNHYGKLPNQTIMSITGHTSEQQFLKYVKTTDEEHFKKIQELWEKQSEEIR